MAVFASIELNFVNWDWLSTFPGFGFLNLRFEGEKTLYKTDKLLEFNLLCFFGPKIKILFVTSFFTSKYTSKYQHEL